MDFASGKIFEHCVIHYSLFTIHYFLRRFRREFDDD